MFCNVSRPGRFFVRTILALAPLSLLALSGCELIGVAANGAGSLQQVAPAYYGLKGQHVGIMVWADEGVSMDHPRIAGDVAGGLKEKLQQGVDANVDELKKTTFFSVNKVLDYQEAHPEAQSDPPEQAAMQFPITRLIYIEVQSLSLHPGESADLSRGDISATVRIIEVNDGKATTAYTNDAVSAIYPPNAPPEGLPGMNDEVVYAKSVDELTTKLGKLFITHDKDNMLADEPTPITQ